MRPAPLERLLAAFTTPRSPTQRVRAFRIGVIVVLYAAVFALMVLVSDPRAAVGVLYVVPIALLALEFGFAGGLAGAAVAAVLLGVWGFAAQPGIPALGY